MSSCLIIDTSIQGVAMALVKLVPDAAGLTYLWQGQHATNAGSLQAIARLMREGLAVTGLTPQRLDALCVGVGPGSFTGIKVGLAFAYGLRSAAVDGLPTFGVSALGAAAEHIARARRASSLVLLLPATRTHGFMARIELKHGSEGPVVESLHLIDVDPASPGGGNAASLLAQGMPEATLVIVGAWPQMEQHLAGTGGIPECLNASEVSRYAIYGMAERSVREWPGSFGAELPLPRYLRLSTAEERLQAAPRLT